MKVQYTAHMRVRYDECDSMGIVHHANYFKYLEIARLEFYKASGGDYLEFESRGLFIVVVRINCNYRMPARFDDELAVTVITDRITEAKIEQSYEILCGQNLLFTARVTLAVIDRSGTPLRIPDCLRSAMEPAPENGTE